MNDPRALCIAYINLAYLYKEQAKPAEAEQDAILALTNARRIEDRHLVGQALGQLAKIKLVQGATEEGIKLFDEAIATLEETDMYEYLKRFCFDYATALEKAGRLAQSLSMLKKAYYYQDKSLKKL